MVKFAFACGVVCALGACTVPDDRPQTLAYVTEAILAPSCGTANCHSVMKRQSNYVFDGVAETQNSLARGNLVLKCAEPPCDENTLANSYLLTVMTDVDIAGNRMPFDAPLPNKDIKFIADWIQNGSEGYDAPPAAP